MTWKQCRINGVVNKNPRPTTLSGQHTFETCASKIHFVDLPLSKSKCPSCTIAMTKPASANTPSTKRIAEPAAELKSEEEKNHDEEKDDEDKGKDQEIEGQQGNQVKPLLTNAQAKATPKGVAKAKAKGKAKAKSSSSKGGSKKQDAKKDKVKKPVKKKEKQGEKKEKEGLLITSVFLLVCCHLLLGLLGQDYIQH